MKKVISWRAILVIFLVSIFIALMTRTVDPQPVTYKAVEPDWKKPHVITYDYLKTLAKNQKKEGKFSADIVSELNGAAVEISGAVIPVDDVPENGRIEKFWLVNPVVVMGGCVFCNPPLMYDMVYVETAKGKNQLKVDREQLYDDIVKVKIKGRFFFGPGKTEDGMRYLFRVEKI